MIIKEEPAINSSYTAKSRLKFLQAQSIAECVSASTGYIPNVVAIDNNKSWSENHNPLSSKGD